jgi:putative nucleotidyltransferase with HDIG domain
MATVLIVDDEPVIRETSRQFLVKQGHDVRVAADVPAALIELADRAIDVVVSDIVMPGADGVELLRLVRERTPHAKVILITGEPSVETATEAVRAGAFDYLAKPVTRGDLVTVVQRAVDFKLLEDENRAYRASLEGLVAARTERLCALLDQIVSALTLAMESRDPYTAGHQRRVAALATAAARHLGYDERHVAAVRMAALLHDLGKLQVPAEILARPSRLSELEFSLVREHAAASYGILAPVDFDDAIAEVVLQHHERLDGSGYPKGLRGDAILPDARLLAVADSLEAMASHRPYRAAIPLADACDELRRARGLTYDGACVDACLAAVDAGEWAP